MKFLSGIVVGIFVGALAVEVLSRKYPGLIDKVEEGGRKAADRLDDLLHRRGVTDTPDY